MGEGFQEGVGEVEVEVAAAEEIAHFAAHDGEERLAGLGVDGWRDLGLRSDLKVVDVDGSSAVLEEGGGAMLAWVRWVYSASCTVGVRTQVGISMVPLL